MNKKLKYLFLGAMAAGLPLAAFCEGESAAAESDAAPQSACLMAQPGPNGPDGKMPGMPRCGMGTGAGPMMMGQGHMTGMGPQMCGGQQQMGMGPMAGPMIPAELRDRMDALRKERMDLDRKWQDAVINRGDKSVEALRAEFCKANAAEIETISKKDKAIRDDIAAIREGYSDNAGAPECSGPCPDPDAKEKASVDAEIVSRINALKGDLTVDDFVRIQQDVIGKRRSDVQKNMRDVMMPRPGMNGPGPMLPPMMAPELARVRDAMGNMRDGPMAENRDTIRKLRDAMKIKDQAKRDEAIKAVIAEMGEGPDAPDAAHDK